MFCSGKRLFEDIQKKQRTLMRHLMSSVCFAGKNEDAVNALRGVYKPSAHLLKTGRML